MKPMVYRFANDSGLAKVWAGDEGHTADKEEVYPGGTFGIVTKSTYLQATTTDLSPDISETVPFLRDEEIHAPRTPIMKASAKKAVQRTLVQYSNGLLTISASRELREAFIYDANGRLVERINLTSSRIGGGQYRVLLKKRVSGVLVIRLVAEDYAETVRLTIGGSL